jgi:hypothetical protein
MSRTREQKLLAVIMAFQNFGGKDFESINAGAEVLTDKELDTTVYALQKMAVRFRSASREKYPDLHKLADQIEEKTGKMQVYLLYPEEKWVEQEEIVAMYDREAARNNLASHAHSQVTLPQMCAALEDAGIIAVGKR